MNITGYPVKNWGFPKAIHGRLARSWNSGDFHENIRIIDKSHFSDTPPLGLLHFFWGVTFEHFFSKGAIFLPSFCEKVAISLISGKTPHFCWPGPGSACPGMPRVPTCRKCHFRTEMAISGQFQVYFRRGWASKLPDLAVAVSTMTICPRLPLLTRHFCS